MFWTEWLKVEQLKTFVSMQEVPCRVVNFFTVLCNVLPTFFKTKNSYEKKAVSHLAVQFHFKGDEDSRGKKIMPQETIFYFAELSYFSFLMINEVYFQLNPIGAICL